MLSSLRNSDASHWSPATVPAFVLGFAEAYRKAVDLNPKDYRAWYGLGQTYELLHMPVYALHYYQRATQVCLQLTA